MGYKRANGGLVMMKTRIDFLVFTSKNAGRCKLYKNWDEKHRCISPQVYKDNHLYILKDVNSEGTGDL